MFDTPIVRMHQPGVCIYQNKAMASVPMSPRPT